MEGHSTGKTEKHDGGKREEGGWEHTQGTTSYTANQRESYKPEKENRKKTYSDDFSIHRCNQFDCINHQNSVKGES